MTSLPPFLTPWILVEFEDTDIDPDILIIKVRTKREKKAENLKFEILFTDDQDVHMRQQTLKISPKMLMSYFCESRSCMWRRS